MIEDFSKNDYNMSFDVNKSLEKLGYTDQYCKNRLFYRKAGLKNTDMSTVVFIFLFITLTTV